MLKLLIVCVVVFSLLLANEWWFRQYNRHSEMSRKLVHITIGSFVAFWPYFLSWPQIVLLGLAFLAVVAISKFKNLFGSIHNVERSTWGELFFALAVGGVALLLWRVEPVHARLIYTIAILHMSLADGLAAIVGVAYGKKTHYQVFGATKSAIGTLTFFVVSVALLSLLLAVVAAYTGSGVVYSGFIAITATVLENLGVLGLDNLLVPFAVALLLTF